MIVPTVIDKVNNSERVYDIYSRLLKDRIIIINGEINNELANSVVAQLLFLDSLNSIVFIFLKLTLNFFNINIPLSYIFIIPKKK